MNGITELDSNVSEDNHPSATKGYQDIRSVTRQRYSMTRHVYNHDDFDKIYGTDALESDKSIISRIKEHLECSKQRLCEMFLSFFPILSFLRNYEIKSFLPRDILAGVTVAFLHIGQGISFGILANLSPAYGLYTSFFPLIVYAIFGTSPHLSVGTQSLIALLVANVIQKQASSPDGMTPSNTTSLPLNITSAMGTGQTLEERGAIAAEFTLYVGIILLLLWILRLSIITTYLSEPFVDGYLSAGGLTIITSLVRMMTGARIDVHSGPLTNIYIWIDFFGNIKTVNLADLTIGLLTLVILIFIKDFISVRCKSKLPIPIPIDIVVIIVATVASYFGDFEGKYDTNIAGPIPNGFLVPAAPPVNHAGNMLLDSFIAAIIVYGLSMSLGKLFAKRHKYKLDNQQELLAFGMTNFVSAFFHCFPSCVAPPRAMLYSQLQAKTTLAGAFSALIVLVVIMFAGDAMRYLPLSCLAAIIMHAVIGLVSRALNSKVFWRVSKYDFVIWFVTFTSTLLLGIDYGFLIGLGFSLVVVIFQGQMKRGSLLRRPKDEDILTSTRGPMVIPIPGVKIYRLSGPLLFHTAEAFKEDIQSLVLLPHVTAKRGYGAIEGELTKPNEQVLLKVRSSDDKISFLILDFRAVQSIDFTGLSILGESLSDCQSVGVTVLIADCNRDIRKTLVTETVSGDIPIDSYFVDIYDALQATTPNSYNNTK